MSDINVIPNIDTAEIDAAIAKLDEALRKKLVNYAHKSTEKRFLQQKPLP
jgi:ribosome recycling factor